MSTTVPLRRVAIVGASLAGLSAAEHLRKQGFDGTITMIGEEKWLPYDRPPLSKHLLKGTWDAARTQLRSTEALEGLDLGWRLGQAAVSLDPGARQVVLADGSTVAYDAVLVATGTTPRWLPNPQDLSGVHTLRTLDDALAIRAALDEEPRVAVVGGGFIGAEVAAEARRRGLTVTMIEALPVPLSRGLGYAMGQVCAEMHLRAGVDVRCGVTVSAFQGDDGRLDRVVLSDGTVVHADLAVVGIGSVPAVDWLSSSGLELDNGVVCDQYCRAGAPGVYAAGDVARWPNELFGVHARVEHWTNAREQAFAAVGTMLADHGSGEHASYTPVPYVWSDQYESRIQVAGHPSPQLDAVQVVHRDTAKDSIVALYREADTLVGALAINAPRLFLPYRRMIASRTRWEEAIRSL